MADIVTTDQLLAEIADYWNKRPDSNLYKLVDIYNSGFNRIANDLETVDDWRAIKEAEGTTLDLIGEDEQAYRVTQDDDAYRFWIWIKFLMSRAQGTIPSMVHIMSTALNAEPEKFEVYKTGLRHVGMKIPWDYVQTLQMQKFIIKNLQNMLAMGYWIDEIVFSSESHVHGYLGAGTTDRWEEQDCLNSTWWTGWREKTDKGGYLATAITDSTNDIEKQDSNWGNSWSAKSTAVNYVATAVTTSDQYIQSLSAVWWTPGKDLETSTGVTFGTQTIINDVQSLDS